jgi:hypothetical protein
LEQPILGLAQSSACIGGGLQENREVTGKLQIRLLGRFELIYEGVLVATFDIHADL